VTVPPAIEAIVMRLLAKDPEARYRDADELVAAIDAALVQPAPRALGAPVPAAETSTHSVVSDAPLPRSGGRWWVGAIVAAVVAAGAAVLLLRTDDPEGPPVAAASASAEAAGAAATS